MDNQQLIEELKEYIKNSLDSYIRDQIEPSREPYLNSLRKLINKIQKFKKEVESERNENLNISHRLKPLLNTLEETISSLEQLKEERTQTESLSLGGTKRTYIPLAIHTLDAILICEKNGVDTLWLREFFESKESDFLTYQLDYLPHSKTIYPMSPNYNYSDSEWKSQMKKRLIDSLFSASGDTDRRAFFKSFEKSISLRIAQFKGNL